MIVVRAAMTDVGLDHCLPLSPLVERLGASHATVAVPLFSKFIKACRCQSEGEFGELRAISSLLSNLFPC